MVSLVFLIAAVILFVVATVMPSPPRFNLIAAGLGCFAISSLIVGRLP